MAGNSGYYLLAGKTGMVVGWCMLAVELLVPLDGFGTFVVVVADSFAGIVAMMVESPGSFAGNFVGLVVDVVPGCFVGKLVILLVGNYFLGIDNFVVLDNFLDLLVVGTVELMFHPDILGLLTVPARKVVVGNYSVPGIHV